MSKGSVVAYCNCRINCPKKTKQKCTSSKREEIETQTSRMRSGMSSHRHACYYEVGLHLSIFIAINSDKIKRVFYSHTQSKPEGCSGDFRHLLWRRISSAIMQQYNCLPKPHRPRNPMPLHFLSCCDYPVASTSRTASLQFMLSISHP
jgi:hypothetical protein